MINFTCTHSAVKKTMGEILDDFYVLKDFNEDH